MIIALIVIGVIFWLWCGWIGTAAIIRNDKKQGWETATSFMAIVGPIGGLITLVFAFGAKYPLSKKTLSNSLAEKMFSKIKMRTQNIRNWLLRKAID